MDWRLNLVLFVAVLALGYGLTHVLFQGAPRMQKTVVSAFEFTDVRGRVKSSDDFQGKILVLNFWATWCAPCVKEFPVLLDLAQENAKDVVLLALSSDIDDAAIEKFLVKYGYQDLADNIYIARDTQGVTGEMFGAYKLPETLVIDRGQRLFHKFIGANWTQKEAQAVLDRL